MINFGSGFSQKLRSSAGAYISRQELLNLRHKGNHSMEIVTRRNNSKLTGEILSSIKGHGIEFTDIRPYQPGDEVRHMDWRTTARTGKLYTRQYNEEKLQTLYLGVDQRIGMFFGSDIEFKSVTCARIAAIIAWAAAARGFQLGGTVVGEIATGEFRKGAAIERAVTENAGTANDRAAVIAKPSLGSHHVTSIRTGPSQQTTPKLINEIAIANHKLSVNCAETPVAGNTDDHRSTGLNILLSQTVAHRQVGSTIYLISDFCGFNEESARSLAALGRKCRVVLLLVSDPLEERLPSSGTVGISDGQLHRNIRLGTRQQTKYQQQRQHFRQEIQRCADKAGAHLLHSQASDALNIFDNSQRASNHRP